MLGRHRAARRFLLCAALLPVGLAHAQSIDAHWQFRLTPGGAADQTHHEATQWHDATVPGNVQSDLMRAGLLPDPYFRDNEAKVQWAGLADWTYRTTLRPSPEDLKAPHLDLVFDGVDTFATVSLNGQVVLKTDNMFRRWTAPDIASRLHHGDNTLEITFRSPVPLMQKRLKNVAHLLPGEFDTPFGDEPKGRQTQSYVRKAGYHYGWDWGPRLLTEGIWQPVRLVRRGHVTVRSMHIGTRALSADLAALSISADVDLDHAGSYDATVHATAPNGKTFDAQTHLDLSSGKASVTVPLTIKKPALWWPIGYGSPSLYRFTVTLKNAETKESDSATSRTGLRTITLLRNHDAFGRAFGFAVNGVPIFAKGANLIPLDMLENRVTPEKLTQLLSMARRANMNMIRVWGGGLYGSDALYNLADEQGFLIWQDFAFGGSITPPDADFAENVRIEAEEQVKRLRDHPSLALWCGNNEMETGWESWPDRPAFASAIAPTERDRIVAGMAHLFGGILPQVVSQLDPETPYWDTTPGTGFDGPVNVPEDGDMHVWSIWGGSKPVTEYLKITPRFQSEYGLESLPSITTLREAMTSKDLGAETTVMRAHQKFAAGNGNQRLSFYLESGYGTPRDFSAFAYLSQVMQADGIALAAEHLRASRPRSMGSLYWQLNDVWQGPSWSAIDYDNRPKALWYRSREFYAPQMVTVLPDIDKGGYSVTAVSDALTPTSGHVTLEAVSVMGGSKGLLSTTIHLAPLAATSAGHIVKIDDPAHEVLVARLEVAGQEISRRVLAPEGFRILKLPDPVLTTQWSPDGKNVTITAQHYAHAVSLETEGLNTQPSDNFFDLLPGESRTISFEGNAAPALIQKALNVRSLYGATK